MLFSRKQSLINLTLASLVTLLVFIIPPKIIFDYDFESFFPQDDEELTFYSAFREKFKNDNDYLLIALKSDPDVFDSLFLAHASDFNEKIKNLEFVEKTASLLDLKQPIIGPFGIRENRVLDWTNEQNLEKSKNRILSHPLLKESFLGKDQCYLLIVVHNQQRILKEDGDKLYQEIVSLLDESGFLEYRVAGKIKAQGEFVRLMQKEFGFFLSISLVLVVFVLFLLFRKWWAVFVPLMVIAIGIIWAIAFSLYLGKPLDIMSVMQPTILSIIGLAGLVHFFNHILISYRQDKNRDAAIRNGFSGIVLAVFLTSLTTSLGFVSLWFTSVPSLKLFGLYTGLGVGFMLLSVIMIAPGLLYLIAPKDLEVNRTLRDIWTVAMHRLLSNVIAHKAWILVLFSLLTLLAIAATSRLKVNGYILDNLPEGHALMEDFLFFDEEFGGSKPFEIALSAGEKSSSLLDIEVLQSIQKLEDFVLQEYEAAPILSPLTLVKALNMAMNGGNLNAFNLPSQGQLLRMEPYFESKDRIDPDGFLTEDYKEGRFSTRTADMGSYRAGILKENLLDFLEKEIDPKVLEVRLTGTSNLIDISHESVSKQLAKGLLVAFLLVALIVGILFRSWRVSFIVLLPNVIPLLCVGLMMWVLGIELKLTTAIIFTVAFGIAVDDSIHMMSKLRLELDKGKSWLYAIKRTVIETGKALTLSTIILVSGFAVLMFSQFGVTFYSGLLISMALIFALISDLILLPVLLFPLGKIKKIRRRQEKLKPGVI